MQFPIETFSKIDAARRQLRVAVLLFFEQRDTIAIHTLTSAALQILADIGKSNGAESFIKDSPYIREDKKKEWLALMHDAQNFFKHADRDPTGTIMFHPTATPFYIIDAVMLLLKLSDEPCLACKAFNAWFCLAYPDLLADGPQKDRALKMLETGTRPENFPLFLKLFHELETHGNAV